MQIFSRSPRGGPAPALSDEELARFDAARRSAGIEPLAVHAPYILNLASPDARVWAQSVGLLREEYARAERLSARYLVTHVGSHRGQGETAGIARVAEAINRTVEDAAWSSQDEAGVRVEGSVPAVARAGVMILLENTAGSAHSLGGRFEHLARIREGVAAAARIGVCLDTAHLFAAGFPIHTPAGLEETVAAFDRCVGLSHLALIHLNDSKTPCGSHVDRHWHIGEGHIGLEAFRRMVTHPRLRELPFILETPKMSEAEDRRNLATVAALASGSGPSADRRTVAASCSPVQRAGRGR
jgi:deoxyribonuclease-4